MKRCFPDWNSVFYLQNDLVIGLEVDFGADESLARVSSVKRKANIPRTEVVVPDAAPISARHLPVLTETDAGFRTLFLHNPKPMWVFDLQTLQFLEVNEAAIRHYGYSREEFLGMLLSDLRPEDIPRIDEEVARARKGGEYRGEWRDRRRDGSLIDVEILSHNVEFRGREAQLAVVRDITKQKQIEQALQQAERKYRLIFEEAIVGIYQSSPDGKLLSANPAMASMFGFDSPEELIASVSDVQPQLYVDPARRDEFKRLMQEQGVVRHFEVQIYRKDRSKMWLWVNGRAVREGDSVVRYEGTLEDITDRKLLEDQLRAAQKQYRDIVEDAVIGIFQSTPDGRYLSVNPAMANMMGYDSPQELVESITDIAHQVYVDPSRREEIRTLANGPGVVKDLECEIYRKDGSKMWISAHVRAVVEDGAVVRYEGMNSDITQRKLLENQLRQAQKMDAVGQLAGGVAHDFNNSLGVITGYSDLLQMNLPPGDPSHKHAEEIAKAGRRAAALTRQLLAFSRQQVIQPVVLDLNSATSELEKMLRRLIGENIEMTFRRGPGLGRVKMDPGQVEQVLMNLSVNARDAMPLGGQICIETANVELDETYARQNAYVIPGSYVMLSVSDTGCGMDKETQRRIFEPFFTTKESGKGTGLGLSTVYGIAKQNAGYIIVYSEVGKGTTFRLYLPRLSDAAKLPLPPQALETIPHGRETVLVVEDETPLRLLARTCLESNGYSVLDAPDAVAALEFAKKHPGPIHLLLTDVVMPGMSGHELANRMIALQPEVKVLYMSGYTNDLINRHGILDWDTVLLEKPFTLHALLTKVYKTLHATKSGKSASAN
jgi:two-component system, cell cycle sensor histidine kinase and response regulator CckA